MELIIGGNTYSTSGKLDAFSQLHVARKLGPALGAVDSLTRPDNSGKDKSLLTVLILAQINDADSEFVVKKCLSVVVRRQEGSLAKVQSSDGQLMFQDIPLEGLLQLTVAVIEENLGDFFRTSLARLGQEEPPPKV